MKKEIPVDNAKNVTTEIQWYERTKEIMYQKKITGTELGKVIGVTQGTMSLKLSGKRGTSVGEIMAIADYLGVNISDLCSGNNDLVNNGSEREFIGILRELTEEQRELAIRLVQTLK